MIRWMRNGSMLFGGRDWITSKKDSYEDEHCDKRLKDTKNNGYDSRRQVTSPMNVASIRIRA